MLIDFLLTSIVILLVAILIVLTLAVENVGIKIKRISSKSNISQVEPMAENGDKYSRNGLSRSVAKDFKDIIIEKMKVGEHYLNPDFKLKDLAQLISLSKHQTSMILNQELEMDFNTYINTLRIKKAQQLLASKKGLQISEVMYQVGFNNSTTFNRAFKKTTHLTPREFVNKYG
ncbi:MAG: hypothetical protein Tsb004_15100 [Allomuricauda sp.]